MVHKQRLRQERRAERGNFKTVPERLKLCQAHDPRNRIHQCIRRRHEGYDHKF